MNKLLRQGQGAGQELSIKTCTAICSLWTAGTWRFQARGPFSVNGQVVALEGRCLVPERGPSTGAGDAGPRTLPGPARGLGATGVCGRHMELGVCSRASAGVTLGHADPTTVSFPG